MAAIPPPSTLPTGSPLEKATSQVLQTAGFSASLASHPCRVHPVYGKCGETQGSEEMRIAARTVTRIHPEAVSLNCLKASQEVNQELYIELLLKRVGHTFGLKRTLTLPYGKKLTLEGWSESFALPMIASSFKAFCQKKELLWAEKAVAALNHALCSDDFTTEQAASTLESIHDPSSVEPIVVSTGWDWHSTAAIFWKGQLAYVNRGAGARFGQPGAHHYQLEKSDQITEELLREMVCRHGIEQKEAKTEQMLSILLGANRFFYHALPNQPCGNCTFANGKGALLTLLAIEQLLMEGVEGSEKEWEWAYSEVLPIFQEWENWDRSYVLDHLLEQAELAYEKKDRRGLQQLFETLFMLLEELPTGWPDLEKSVIERFERIRALRPKTPPTPVSTLRDFDFSVPFIPLPLEGEVGSDE